MKLTVEEMTLIEAVRRREAERKAQGWRPKPLGEYAVEEKVACFDRLYDFALEYFNEQKSGGICEDNDYGRYALEGVVSLLGDGVWATIAKFGMDRV